MKIKRSDHCYDYHKHRRVKTRIPWEKISRANPGVAVGNFMRCGNCQVIKFLNNSMLQNHISYRLPLLKFKK